VTVSLWIAQNNRNQCLQAGSLAFGDSAALCCMAAVQIGVVPTHFSPFWLVAVRQR
jgi:hypothetical protein